MIFVRINREREFLDFVVNTLNEGLGGAEVTPQPPDEKGGVVLWIENTFMTGNANKPGEIVKSILAGIQVQVVEIGEVPHQGSYRFYR